jgi:hypothetical protein
MKTPSHASVAVVAALALCGCDQESRRTMSQAMGDSGPGVTNPQPGTGLGDAGGVMPSNPSVPSTNPTNPYTPGSPTNPPGPTPTIRPPGSNPGTSPTTAR